MSVPPQLMQQMMRQQGGGAAPGPGGAPAPGAGPGSQAARTMPPAAAPFATPQEKRGNKASAMANIHIAMTLLEQALPDLGADTPEYDAVLKSLNSLVKTSTKRDNTDLVPAEVMQMVQQLPQMGGGTPIQQELMRQQRAGAARPPGAGAPPPQGAM